MILPHDINAKNQELLKELQKSYHIEFKQRENPYCEVFMKDTVCTIFYNPDTTDDESVAHELLHIWLDTFNYVSGNIIYLSCLRDIKLRMVFTKELCDHIGNCIDHMKMYPTYLKMGYSADKFLVNALSEKSNLHQIKNLQLNMYGDVYSASHIEAYIGNLISIYADHVPNNYAEHLNILQQLDNKLFYTVTQLWNNWENFDHTSIDAVYNSDTELMFNFVHQMEAWCSNKILL